jgi:hypothetical protein
MSRGHEHDDGESDGYGLWSNLEHIKRVADWSQKMIAQFVQPYTDEADLKTLQDELSKILKRRQRNWKHAAAMEKALGLPSDSLRMDDMRREVSLKAMNTAYGFNRADVIRRWREQAQKDKGWLSSTPGAWKFFCELGHYMAPEKKPGDTARVVALIRTHAGKGGGGGGDVAGKPEKDKEDD